MKSSTRQWTRSMVENKVLQMCWAGQLVGVLLLGTQCCFLVRFMAGRLRGNSHTTQQSSFFSPSSNPPLASALSGSSTSKAPSSAISMQPAGPRGFKTCLYDGKASKPLQHDTPHNICQTFGAHACPTVFSTPAIVNLVRRLPPDPLLSVKIPQDTLPMHSSTTRVPPTHRYPPKTKKM